MALRRRLRFFVASARVRDLLLCAKHLFIAAKTLVAGFTLLSRVAPAWDLLLRAKHLFVAAMEASAPTGEPVQQAAFR
jgi:hypothetical protein